MTDRPPEADKEAELGAAASGPRIAPPVLDQAGVDAIAGYEDLVFDEPGGLRAVLDPPGLVLPPMPTLRSALERFAQMSEATLPGLLKGEAHLALVGIEARRLSLFLDGLARPAQIFAFTASGWGGGGLLVLDADCTELALERVLGGRRAAGARPAPRPATSLETGIVSQLASWLLEQAERAFAPVAPVTFTLAAPGERSVDIAPGAEAAVVASFELGIDAAFGRIDLVLPASTLEPIRDVLSAPFTGGKLGRDELWAAHLATEVWQAGVEAEAVLHETRMPLGKVLDLAIGDTLMLDVRPTDVVELRSGRVLLTRGRMGRVEGRISVQVTEALRPARPSSWTVPGDARGPA